MLCKAILVVTLIVSSSATALAQFSGTPREQAACRGDVAKLCRGVKGEQSNMLECLVGHRSKLSAKCRAVLESHGKLPAQ
jgi:Cysteine rich repeat